MNLHEIPAFTQNFSIDLTSCVPTSNDALCTITKSESLKQNPEKKYFQKIAFSFVLFFFFFRMSRPSGNLVIATELLIA